MGGGLTVEGSAETRILRGFTFATPAPLPK